uniref:ACT domain-containing protein ACR n=1 Tax=Kalanchoe fedtschenkoi TaxID=63787 RepID=A0A7N0TLC3_KALFE
MGIPSDDVVLIQNGKSPNDPTVITVSCPDQAGLGCDICRIILEFGLFITRGDFSTDGRWCYVVLRVLPHPISVKVDWASLKNRLVAVCPSLLFSYCFDRQSGDSSTSSVFLLNVFCLDRKGLLHDVTEVLCKLELVIQRVKVMTMPDGRVLDLFFITDGLNLLHTKQRRDDTCEQLVEALGEFCIGCDIQLAGPEFENQHTSSTLPSEVAEQLFSSNQLNNSSFSITTDPYTAKLKKASITIDNHLSPSHTMLRIECSDQKGLFYDMSRISKDCGITIAHARVSASVKGCRNMDLLIQKTDGQKIIDPDYQSALCSRLKEEMFLPLRMIITNRGPDTELVVANPVELSGKGRPRVFYDVTFALKVLGICIFSAEIGRHTMSDRQWEVYRFLLDDSRDLPLSSIETRTRILKQVRRTLMGW